MNTREKNKLAMLQSIKAVINQHQEVVNATPALAEVVAEFFQTIEEIIRNNQEYLSVTQGVVAAKNNSLDDCVEHTFRIGNAIYALGRKTSNEEFKSAVCLSMSEIKNKREADIEQYCSRIADLAKACTAELASAGIQAQEIDVFNKALDTYHQQADVKKAKTAESMAARKSLSANFDKADEILTSDIDPLIEVVKTSDEVFYHQYKAARTIRDLGGHISKNDQPEPVATPAISPALVPAVT